MMHKLTWGALAVLFWMLATGAQAQDRETARSTNSWFSMVNEFRLSPKWYLYHEAHLRRAEGISEKQQVLLRPALAYRIHPNVDFFVGYSYVKTYPYGEQPVQVATPENHLWQQLLVRQTVGKVGLLHRYRLEERWVGRTVETSPGAYAIEGTDYMNRFRYRIFARVPLYTPGEGPQELFAVGWDELFIHLDKDLMPLNVNQNRFFLGLGYQFSAMGNIQAGYMDHVIRKNDLRYERNPTLNIALFYNIDFYKK